LLACALFDSYGAGFEYAPMATIKAKNTLQGYIQHHKWKTLKPGHYTDDTQMAMAVMEHMLEERPWTPYELATRFVGGFHRDPRAGYAGGFYKFLQATKNGGGFLAGIQPHSNKSGGAMRAFPLGALTDPEEVRDKAMFQASLTHATYDGMRAAAAAALAFHHRYHNVGDKEEMLEWVSEMVGYNFIRSWEGQAGVQGGYGLHIVHAALESFYTADSLMGCLHSCIAWGGDVDTVAAIAGPIAAVCSETELDISQPLLDGLENGTFGQDYIRALDAKFLEKYPRQGIKERSQAVEPAMNPDAIAELFGG
jgi:ADP-ribosyl-[dinitrogen reductase] hydrolase